MMCLLGVAELEAEILQPQRTELVPWDGHCSTDTSSRCDRPRVPHCETNNAQETNQKPSLARGNFSRLRLLSCLLVLFFFFLSTYLFISRTAEASAVWFCVFKWEVEGCGDACVAIVSPHAHTTRQPVTSGACC